MKKGSFWANYSILGKQEFLTLSKSSAFSSHGPLPWLMKKTDKKLLKKDVGVIWVESDPLCSDFGLIRIFHKIRYPVYFTNGIA